MFGVPHVLLIIVSWPKCHLEVIRKTLRSAIDLPSAQNVERLRIEHERSARSVAVRRAERADIDAFRPAMHGVRGRVSRALRHFLGLDDPDDRRLPGPDFVSRM
jgi:hypothetical protein